MSRMISMISDFATEQRGWFVTVFVLPLSLMYSAWFRTRSWMVLKMFSAPKLHRKRVQGVVDQILSWRQKTGGKGRLCTARGGWESITLGSRDYKKVSTQIAINLYDVLELNEKQRWVHVEPLVSMGQLSHYLIQKGWTLPVLPELDDLTVGGLYMGVGIETSSHKYGLFNDSVLEAEVVLADGRVVICSPRENQDIFDALPWSYGTLGFLVSVKLAIIPCKAYVRVEYIPCHTLAAGVEVFSRLSHAEQAPDFVEGLMYSKERMVVMPGTFVDAPGPGERVNAIGQWHKPWFFKHVEAFLGSSGQEGESSSNHHTTECIPLRDYYHRHTKAIFWELQDIIPFGNHPLYRWLLGWAVPPKVSFLKLTSTPAVMKMYETAHVLQDMLVPLHCLVQALEVFHTELEVYPLWLCPYRAYDYTSASVPHRGFLRRPSKVEPGKRYEMYVDIGAYGVPARVREKDATYDTLAHTRAVERYVLHHARGFQMLYAVSHLDHAEFRQMFDHSHYDEMKHKLDPTGAFPEVFQKTCKLGHASFSQNLVLV